MKKEFLMMMPSRQSVLALVAMTAIAVSANAKPKPFPTPAALPEPPPVTVMSEEQYQKALKDAKTTTRRVADIDNVNEATALSDDLKNLRSDVIGGSVWVNKLQTRQKAKPGVQDIKGITDLIADLEGRYDSLAMDAKLVAAQIIALKPYRSIIYRARHLIDNAEFSKASVVGMLRMAASGQNAFFPTEQWKAGFDFFTAPSADMGPDINTEEDLHVFIRTQALPALTELKSKVLAMNFSTPVYFDNKMAYAAANFISDDDRYALIGETERIAALSGLAFAISGVHSSLAYNWLGMFDTADQMARVYGFRNAIPFTDFVDVATAKKRNEIVNRNKVLFTLKSGGETWTRAAYPYFKEGVQYAKLAWSMAKKDGNANNNLNNLLDPRGFLPATRQVDTGFANIESLIAGDGMSSAVVGGEKVDVKFREIFDNPPEDLKVFMAVKYNNDEKVIQSEFARDKKGDLAGGYRNYMRGSPAEWCIADCVGANKKPAKSYGHYFPNVKSADDIKRSARILNQTWGGALIGASLGAMIF
jgi:hypothetical protein